jgi:hypothetical protein
MTILRRFVVFQLFLFWQGGFLFYSAIVVPIGTEVLGSALVQGTITQLVTNWLNIIGGFWSVAMIGDLFLCVDSRKWRKLLRLGLVLFSVGLLIALFWIHPKLDELLDLETHRIADKSAFRFWHVVYLWICTFHWLIGLVLAWLTLAAWRNEDQMH